VLAGDIIQKYINHLLGSLELRGHIPDEHEILDGRGDTYFSLTTSRDLRPDILNNGQPLLGRWSFL
jgi:hypothetical protein